ncbi:MAG: hypothetical protein Ct9H300mP11_22860 [Chloroflexota bacterium]|nr:MAG: hypothetical protein Ct9H300mP11_22860 [Chloroflexota bacterium]
MASEHENQLDQAKFSPRYDYPGIYRPDQGQQSPFLEIYESVNIPKDSLSIFAELTEPLNLAVFTADWCGEL